MKITILLVNGDEFKEFDNPLMAKAFINTLQNNQWFSISIEYNGKLIYYEYKITKCRRIYDILRILIEAMF